MPAFGGAAESRIATVSGAVLVGGASSRMGRDKARLPLGGVANATRLARLLAGLFEEVLLVGGSPPPEAPGRRVGDPEGPVCALRGLVAALEAARGPRVLVVATDLPLLTPDLLLGLVAWPEADVVVPRTEEGLHPLCGLYRRGAVLPNARRCLAAGRLRVQASFDGLDVSTFPPEEVSRLDPDGAALTNLNTPEEVARAEALLLARAGRTGAAAPVHPPGDGIS